mmetsp:Transcript_63311/g.181638  ORF Transcript_63311/g.181638 Transcript_63311/m.181638 type:complete len:346 (-) Transcript_63311:109-1146(-)
MITTAPLRVRVAATVICIRRSRRATAPLTKEEATGGERAWEGAGGDGPSRINLVFGRSDSASFEAGWETLLGQGECQNWVRSSPDKLEAMRYPGEWKFAGGAVEPGETPVEAAKRELEEEFQVKLPEDSAQCKFHLLSIKQTRPIRNVSNIMYNFVAAAEENAWLESLDAARINAALAARRERHRAEVKDGSFWHLSKALREQVSPEIREVLWLDMRSAILHTFTSMNDSCVPVNAFQEEEFARLGIRRRDPMFLTMATLLEVESFPSVQSLALYSGGICPENELKRIQWLTDGMSPEDVRRAWERNISPTDQGRKGMFRTAEERLALRRSREQEDTRATGASRL